MGKVPSSYGLILESLKIEDIGHINTKPIACIPEYKLVLC